MTPGRFPAPLSQRHVGVTFCHLLSLVPVCSEEQLWGGPEDPAASERCRLPAAPEASASLGQNELGPTLMHIAQLGIEKVWGGWKWKFLNQI